MLLLKNISYILKKKKNNDELKFTIHNKTNLENSGDYFNKYFTYFMLENAD